MMAQHVPRDDPMNEDDEEELEALEAAANAALAAADALMNPSVEQEAAEMARYCSDSPRGMTWCECEVPHAPARTTPTYVEKQTSAVGSTGGEDTHCRHASLRSGCP